MDKELIRHIIVDKKEEYTDNPSIKDSDIVYIKDTKEIFTHKGHYGGPLVKEGTFNVEEIIIEESDESIEFLTKEEASETYQEKLEEITAEEVKEKLNSITGKSVYELISELTDKIDSYENKINELNTQIGVLNSYNKVKVLTSEEYQQLLNTDGIEDKVVYITEDEDASAATLELDNKEFAIPLPNMMLPNMNNTSTMEGNIEDGEIIEETKTEE